MGGQGGLCTLFLICLSFCGRLHAEDRGFRCNANHTKNGTTLPKLLGDSYRVKIQLANLGGNETGTVAELEELRNGSSSGLFLYLPGGVLKQWIFHNTSRLHIDGSKVCNVTNGTAGQPLNVSTSLMEAFAFGGPWSGLQDLFASARSKSVRYWNESNVTSEHGLPGELWVGCVESKDRKKWLEFAVWHTPEKYPYVDKKAGRVPLRVELKSYDKNKTKAEEWKIYEVFFVRSDSTSRERERYLLPPRGVFCNGWNGTERRQVLPKKFVTNLLYTNSAAKENLLVNLELAYDRAKKVVAFTYTGQYEDIAFLKNVSGIINATGRYRIIHDFIYGYEYILRDGGDSCLRTAALSADWGDAVPTATGRKLTLRNSTDLLLGFERTPLNLTCVGERVTEEGVPAEVCVGRAQDAKTKENLTCEIWFTTNKWAVETVYGRYSNQSILRVDVYREAGRTTQHYGSIADFEKTSFPQALMDIEPCLNLTADSYLYIILGGEKKLRDLQSFGLERVSSALREKLAEMANVSTLRIGHFLYEETDGGITVFFHLGEKSRVKPNEHTEWFRAEITGKAAGRNLNESMKEDVTLIATNFDDKSISLTLTKQSLRVVPKNFHPYNPKPVVKQTGYSGGSMAALAICMLLIGGACGLVVAFFLWKRNRGIAYQVYE